jgi:hypothetical protein
LGFLKKKQILTKNSENIFIFLFIDGETERTYEKYFIFHSVATYAQQQSEMIKFVKKRNGEISKERGNKKDGDEKWEVLVEKSWI